ncbi:MAG: XRE family transcriptional regulator [Proteobacteria bacterium]|nr:MAG: XRE family transcriptional regulator [Pseudomonadota bacterium]
MDITLLQSAFRAILREKGISQPKLAALAGVSLPTAKRWVKGEGISLQEWLKLLTLIGVSLPELLERAGAAGSAHFTYTPSQEEALASTRGLLAYLDLLLGGKTPAAIAKAHALSNAVTSQYLAKLEKVGLIEWLPKDKVRLLIKGEPRWNPAGPLAKKFRRQTLRELTDAYGDDPAAFRIGVYDLSSASRAMISEMNDKFFETLRLREIEDRRRHEKLDKFTVAIGRAGFIPSMLRLDK